MIETNEGGCLFCGKDDGDLVYEKQFDTYVHLHCIRFAIKESHRTGEPNLEAWLMEYLLADLA